MPKKGKDWERSDRILRGLSPLTPEQAAQVRDMPTEDGGPVREPADEPFLRDPKLVEADRTPYTGDDK
jgi:hypothetical protein